MRRGWFVLIALVAVAAVLLAGAPRAGAQTPVAGRLTGPSALAPGAAGAFFLNASGGPAGEGSGNFSIKYYITGTDTAGGVPIKSSPGTVAGNPAGRFEFNITAPQREQVITVVVEINSTAGPRFEKATVTRAVTVITPIVLAATFRNDGGAAAVNITVTFYVDGKLAGTAKISRIQPKATATATFSYLPVGLAPGAHSVRVEADLNKNGVIEADKGEVAVLDVFYKKDFELTWPYAGVIIVATVSISALVIRARRRRR